MCRLTAEHRDHLDRLGYVLVEGALTASSIGPLVDHLEHLWHAEGSRAGIENFIEPQARRLASLVDKGVQFRPIFTHPLALDACRHVMGGEVRLTMLNARDALPHTGRQVFHCDSKYWGRPDDEGYFACTAIWMLDDFTDRNGATCVVPRSHLMGMVPQDALDDCAAPHPDEVRVLGKRGDVLFLNGHCWHAGGENRTDKKRRAILAHYLRADHMHRREVHRQFPSAATLAELNRHELMLFGAA